MYNEQYYVCLPMRRYVTRKTEALIDDCRGERWYALRLTTRQLNEFPIQMLDTEIA